MTSLKSDSLNDFVVENNDLSFITGLDEKVQILKENLRLFFGEWFLDVEIGVPYFQLILKKNIDPIKANSALKNVILNSKDVLELISFKSTFNQSTRSLKIDFSVRFDESVVSFSEVLL